MGNQYCDDLVRELKSGKSRELVFFHEVTSRKLSLTTNELDKRKRREKEERKETNDDIFNYKFPSSVNKKLYINKSCGNFMDPLMILQTCS